MNPTSTLIGPTTADPTVVPPILTNLPPPTNSSDPLAAPFDAAYWASQPPAIQQFRGMSKDDAVALAAELFAAGYLIDYIIMVDGWDPYVTMALRVQGGWTWTYSMNQTVTTSSPNNHVPGLADYNPDPPYPPNSIEVRTTEVFSLPYQAPAKS